MADKKQMIIDRLYIIKKAAQEINRLDGCWNTNDHELTCGGCLLEEISVAFPTECRTVCALIEDILDMEVG